MEKNVIATVRNYEELCEALKSSTDKIFMLAPNISTLGEQVEMVHKAGKKVYIHLDLAEGIGKDEYGIRFAKDQGVDGIISTRTNIIKLSRRLEMFTIQRFFIVDSQSVETSIDSAKMSKADMIEIMPGNIAKVIKRLKTELDMPIVAGGLIETEEELKEAISCGAAAVSTSIKDFWR